MGRETQWPFLSLAGDNKEWPTAEQQNLQIPRGGKCRREAQSTHDLRLERVVGKQLRDLRECLEGD